MKHFPASQYDMIDQSEGKTFNQPSCTNIAGAMTKKQQIQRLMAQGQINRAWANGMFPGTSDVPEDFVPPDYSPDAMSILDEMRAIVRGKKTGEAKAWAKERQDKRGEADQLKAHNVAADADTRDNITREEAPSEP